MVGEIALQIKATQDRLEGLYEEKRAAHAQRKPIASAGAGDTRRRRGPVQATRVDPALLARGLFVDPVG